MSSIHCGIFSLVPRRRRLGSTVSCDVTERERERLDNAEACYLYFSFHTASSVYSCFIKEANIPLSGSYAHSNHEKCFYILIIRVVFKAISSTVIKEITLVAPGGGELVLRRPEWLRRRLEP